MENALQYSRDHFDDSVSELMDFLRIPSISTDPDYAPEVRRAAEWVADHMRELGIQNVDVLDTPGHPIVYGEYLVDPAAPTILVYGHYDVQPPDPLELWDSPPFEPVVKDGNIYGRGTCDDKGQVFMHVKAAEAYLQGSRSMPLNVKYIIEGEEENGSTSLPQFLIDNKEMLSAEVVVVSDTALFGNGVPAITYGLRGLAYVEVTLTGPDRDLHSGVYGGAIHNPINCLASLIAGMHDENHVITIPGFYDSVVPLKQQERDTFASLPFDDQEWIEDVGVSHARTADGYSILEATTARPALDCNGIWGGYTADGAKTVLPSMASAKISARLVPDQTPDEITAKIQKYFEQNAPDTMKVEVRDLHGGHGVLVDTDSPAMSAASEAMEAVFSQKPFFIRGGGSIPIVADFKKILGLESVLLGFGLDSDAIHSPNEHYGLDRFQAGIESIIRFMQIYSAK
jgi:acetylornithine deacetylase/succinyl-diaminopimelate desuccinylase-like protein